MWPALMRYRQIRLLGHVLAHASPFRNQPVRKSLGRSALEPGARHDCLFYPEFVQAMAEKGNPYENKYNTKSFAMPG